MSYKEVTRRKNVCQPFVKWVGGKRGLWFRKTRYCNRKEKGVMIGACAAD